MPAGSHLDLPIMWQADDPDRATYCCSDQTPFSTATTKSPEMLKPIHCRASNASSSTHYFCAFRSELPQRILAPAADPTPFSQRLAVLRHRTTADTPRPSHKPLLRRFAPTSRTQSSAIQNA